MRGSGLPIAAVLGPLVINQPGWAGKGAQKANFAPIASTFGWRHIRISTLHQLPRDARCECPMALGPG